MVTQAVLLQRITRAPSIKAIHTMEARPAVATAQASVDARAPLSPFLHKRFRGHSRVR
jgi:hypothetical protein